MGASPALPDLKAGAETDAGRTRKTRSDPRRAHSRARRVVGRAHPARGARGGRLPRRPLPRPPARCRRRPRPPQPDAARDRARHPPVVLRGRRGHRLDQHLHRHAHRPGRLCARGLRRRDEPRRSAHRARGCRRVRRPRRRLRRPAQRHAVAVAEGGGRCVPRGHLRPGGRDVRRADGGAARRRCRPFPDRDHFRLAQREGGDRRRTRRGAGGAAVAVVHSRRPQRPQPVRADGGVVLGLGRAGEAARRRGELLARRDRDAAVRGGYFAGRDDVGRVLSERGAAE